MRAPVLVGTGRDRMWMEPSVLERRTGQGTVLASVEQGAAGNGGFPF